MFGSRAGAQTVEPPARVTITATRSVAGITGFGNLSLADIPLSVGVTSAEQMLDLGIRRLSDLARIDASVGDGYNTEGYYDFMTIRGFVIDNRFNYRRDGLPISGETSLPLENKSRIEVLKGTSGMQSGIGSPGGIINLVVKRPTESSLRDVWLGWRQDGSLMAATDLSDRFGDQRQVGLRLNAAYERLDPQTYVAEGSRFVLALAGDWRVSADTLLEAEIEYSHREQPSVPGFSVLGSVVPAPGNPRINLNNQPWSQPTVFDGTTASLRWRQRLDAKWNLVAQAATQQLKTDDNIAFPYGCSAEGFYDRYCSDGTYDLYDFRSPGEKRRNNVVDLALNGALFTGTVHHDLTLGLQFNQVTNRFHRQAFNYAGVGNVQGTLFTPPAPDLTGENTDRDARSTELYLRDAIAFNEQTTLWLGLRHTRQDVNSVRTDGSEGHWCEPELQRAVGGTEPPPARRHAGVCQLRHGLRIGRGAEPAALHQPGRGFARHCKAGRSKSGSRACSVTASGPWPPSTSTGPCPPTAAVATATTVARACATEAPCTAASKARWPAATVSGISAAAPWRCTQGAKAVPTPASTACARPTCRPTR